MSKVTYVSTRNQLKWALKNEDKYIVITEPDLAGNVKVLKYTSRAVILAALSITAIAVTNVWNPIGWGAGFIGIAVVSSTVTVISAIGISAGLIWLIYDSYDIIARGRIELPDGTILEGEVILKRN
ncbi:hypothetical protein [Shewanella acanthi]|uniref:hypothetical protein n=1 Tax=Shewanella acanthi TaxID=2864212 RepID=UPI001C65EDFB|nr:hypothetical protein [Shewanella acanthi]QYJ77936.1 hypothetical protein K0H61_12505 [Shewanella acanthi]